VQRSVNECKCANPGGTFDHCFIRGGLLARGTLGHLKRRNDWPSPLLKRKLGKVEFRCFLEVCYRLRTFGARALALRPVALIYRPALARGADFRAAFSRLAKPGPTQKAPIQTRQTPTRDDRMAEPESNPLHSWYPVAPNGYGSSSPTGDPASWMP